MTDNPPAGSSSPSPVLHSRDAINHDLRIELLGPSEELERLRDRPSTHYLCGILWPEGTEVEPDQDEQQPPGDDEEDPGGFESAVPLIQTLSPSSIGLSVVVDANEEELEVRAEWAEYIRETDEAHDDGGGTGRTYWQRVPTRPEPITIPLGAGRHVDRRRVSDDGRIQVEWLVRPLGQARAISVFLINRRVRSDVAVEREERTVFQPKLTVSPAGNRPSIIGRPPNLALATSADEDLRANSLLFREELEFAVGHGCAAGWTRDGALTDCATAAWTEMVPTYELPATESLREIPGLELDMSVLAEVRTGPELRGLLDPLVAAYTEWTDGLEESISSLPDHWRAQAQTHVDGCRTTCSRIADGIDLLAGDQESLRAFRLMNAAMLLQRTHSDWALDFRQTGIRLPEPQPRGTWRPFQLAFILQCLRGCSDPAHEDRGIADLLWFPTGGGKTEAYLGIAAFVAILRRFRSGNDVHQAAGVCVLMRYTLRLLTVQQFQRAGTLACALEVLRATESDLGSEPFRVGLWVGRGTTPNTFEDSETALADLAAAARPDGGTAYLESEGSPVQLVSCPWCGEPLTHRNYRADVALKRTFINCGRAGCPFVAEPGIPAVVVDEEIYRTLPTVLIGTVDKFARLPWKGETQTIFGRVNRHCPRHGYLSPADGHSENRHNVRNRYPAASVTAIAPIPPPQLIIQDELHLISGPLGSMMGLYEAGIDWLCTEDDGGNQRQPKIIASTATIRRAANQIWALFVRNVRVFPPPGLVHTDSFFAQRVALEEKPGRLYVGVYAPGKSVKTAQVRTMSLLLAAGAQQFEADPVQADPYMSLIGYYNSIRELGGAMNLVRDDIKTGRLAVLAGRGFPHRRLYEIKELTSRESSRQIPRTLDQLSVRHVERETGKYPIDVLLATSMISVGVDILRLGLMVVVGQPKATAEYIQATSRVGRQAPGLVVTIYNWSRPRDLSHFERFLAYHSSLYRHVEASSATPFSSRARDRALHGIYVGMLRAADFDLTPEASAVTFDRRQPVASAAVDVLWERARALSGQEEADATRSELEARQDRWEHLTHGGPLRYSWESTQRAAPVGVAVLLRPAGTEREGIWPTPGSLREVEPGVGFYLQEDFA